MFSALYAKANRTIKSQFGADAEKTLTDLDRFDKGR
jgi:hypothetical protein